VTGRRAEPAAPAPSSPAAPPAVPSASLPLRRELQRKLLHVSSALAPLAYAAGLPREQLLTVLGVMLVVAGLVELTRRRLAIVHERFMRATGVLLRGHEHQRVVGATWLLLAFTAAVWLLPRDVAIAVMWAVAVGDAVAAVVGKSLGRLRIGRANKTLEGSLACCLATAAGALLVAGLSPLESGVAGLAAAAAEWPDTALDDNARVAFAVAASVLVMRYALAGS
jgi:dolichol kinase